MATSKKAPRTYTATDHQRSRAIDTLLCHEDPVVRRAAMAAVERVMRDDLSKWDRTTVQQHVLWSVKFAAERLQVPVREEESAWFAERAAAEITAILADPRAQGLGKSDGVTQQVVRNAIVAWAAPPGRPPKKATSTRDKAPVARKKEAAALALLKAIQISPDGGLEAMTKLIDRKIGRRPEPSIDLGYFGSDPKPPP